MSSLVIPVADLPVEDVAVEPVGVAGAVLEALEDAEVFDDIPPLPEKSEQELRLEAERAAEELRQALESKLALTVQRLWRGFKARKLVKEMRTKAMFDAIQATAASQGPKLSHVRVCVCVHIEACFPPHTYSHRDLVGNCWTPKSTRWKKVRWFRMEPHLREMILTLFCGFG
jgi:hypothetical protein